MMSNVGKDHVHLDMAKLSSLPITANLSEIVTLFSSSKSMAVRSTPGSGKTTIIPPVLLNNVSGKILVLIPKKAAAKFAALRVSELINENIGETVGYAFKHERVVGPLTRLIFMTEGTFLRHLLTNPHLEGISVVILDEFHERHLQTDLALGISRHLQLGVRPDLKLVIMSATIDLDPLKKYFNDGLNIFDIETPVYPLEIEYLENRPSVLSRSLEKKVLDAINFVWDYSGDILIFLPGMREILDVQKTLSTAFENNHSSISLFILHGDLDRGEQDLVMHPSSKRKIILSTNLAESSITIPGVRIVIDSGLAKVSHFDHRTNLGTLQLKKIAKSQAIQRAGRAAREAKGYCYRLYSKAEYETWPMHTTPEILKSDLSEVIIQMGALNLIELLKKNEFPWYSPPPPQGIESAFALLKKLGALSSHDELTNVGREMSFIPLHPRWARSLVWASEGPEEELKKTIHYIAEIQKDVGDVRRFIQQCNGVIKAKNKRPLAPIEKALLAGHPDRLAKTKQNEGNTFELITADGNCLAIAQEEREYFDPGHRLWLVLTVNHKGLAAKIVAIEEDWPYELDPFPIEELVFCEWSDKSQKILISKRLMIGKIVLEEEVKAADWDKENDVIKDQIKNLLLKQVRPFWERWSKGNGGARAICYIQLFSPEIVNLNVIEKELEGFVLGKTCLSVSGKEEDVESELELWALSLLQSEFDKECRILIDQFLPKQFKLPSQKWVEIHYESGGRAPWIEGHIQDFYGLSETPTIAGGRLKLAISLLGPHKRPVQVTQDLMSFWTKTYKELYKEFSREYPRHHWAINPMNAPAILLKRNLPPA